MKPKACPSLPVFIAVLTALMASAMVSAQRAPASAPPQVSTGFQAEASRLAAEGLTLKEALETSLEVGAQHLAAIFQRANPKDPSQTFEFRIIENDGRTVKTIFRRTEFYFSFKTEAKTSKLNATDINGDGLKEIIVESGSGGNCWSCNPTEIYRVRNHKGELIAAGPIQKLTDLDADGLQELLVLDTRWEDYEYFSHAFAPGAVMVYAWRNGQYVYTSRDFPAYYKSEIERLRNSIEEAKAQITAEEFSDMAYVSRVVCLAITYAHMGEPERGLTEMEMLLNSNTRSEAQAKHRGEILKDFRNGESNKKLREMKYGDPLPIN